MESQYIHSTNGQSVLQSDMNLLGETSGLADDRVFAELFRMQPYDGSTVRRAVLPYRHAASTTAFIGPNGASGTVLVNPFRAFVGSRTAVASDAKKNWRDIRSAIGVGSTTLGQSVSLAANSSGNPRWDLIYAAVAVDANSATVTRKVKDPSTKVITGTSVVVSLATTVTLGVVTGTAGASPVTPSLPSDSGGTYYIPLAFVRVPDGFGASSTVVVTDICTCAPVLTLASSTGGQVIEVADTLYTVDNSLYLTNARMTAWGASGTRPNAAWPSTLRGGCSLIIPIGLITGSETHVDGQTLDSRDWRGRLCRYTAGADNSFGAGVSWQSSGGVNAFPPAASCRSDPSGTNYLVVGFGNTMTVDSTGDYRVADAKSTAIGSMASSTQVLVYCDASTGRLKLSISGAPDCRLLFWLEFTGRFDNAF